MHTAVPEQLIRDKRMRRAPPPRVSRRHSARGPMGAAQVLALQRFAGNRATAALLQRQVGVLPGTTARPELQKGSVDRMVGVLQQKLNVLGEKLTIDAEFGGKTQAAVRKFQAAHGMKPPSGIADAATWAVLDRLAPGGDVQPDGSLSPVKSPLPADPNSPSPPNTDVKPVLKRDVKGVAVAELQEKLTVLGASFPAVSGGLKAGDAVEFDEPTETAVKAFQRSHPPLSADGIVGKRTWAVLDQLVPGAAMGRVQRIGTETARGEEFGGRVNYDWALEPDATKPKQLAVRVRYAFINPKPKDNALPLPNKDTVGPSLLAGITKVWNVFKAVEEPVVPGKPTRPSVDIDFRPEVGTPADTEVALALPPGHSNTRLWFIDPKDDLVGLAAHEFGHHFGLQDEYQQTAADHMRQTGEAAPVGDAAGDGTPPEVVAREIGAALRKPPRADHGDNTLAVIRAHKLTQGAFAQRVASRYLSLFGTSVVFDCKRLIDEDRVEGAMTKRRLCSQPFLYTADNLMGGAETQGSKHAHDVAPRHVRHLSALVEKKMGGIWNPQNR